jgi:hypothetical protein
MANNDSVLIPYVIQEGSLWYVAYKEKNPFVPEITVSAKGIANHTSEEINDGADFGPDSYNPSVTSGVPLTQTSGIQEAFDYFISTCHVNTGLGGSYAISDTYISILAGNFNINETVTLHTSSLPSNATGGLGFLYIKCAGANTQFSVNVPDGYGIEIPADATTTNLGFVWDGGTYSDTSSTLGFIHWDFGVATFSGSAWIDFKNLNWNEQNPAGYTVFLRGMVWASIITNNGSSVTGAQWFLHALSGITWISQPGIFGSSNGENLNLSATQISVSGASNIMIQPDGVDIFNCDISMFNGKNGGNITYLQSTNSTNYIMNTLNIHDSSYLSLDIQNRITNLSITNCIAVNNTTTYLLSNSSTAAGAIWFLYIRNFILTVNGQLMYDNTNLSIEYSDIKLNNGNAFVGTSAFINFTNSPTITNPPVSGTVYQNTNPYDIRLKIPITYNPSTTAAATLATGISSSSTVTTSIKTSLPSGLTAADGQILTYDMVVPAGWYFELVTTNATIGTVEVEAA